MDGSLGPPETDCESTRPNRLHHQAGLCANGIWLRSSILSVIGLVVTAATLLGRFGLAAVLSLDEIGFRDLANQLDLYPVGCEVIHTWMDEMTTLHL